MADILYARRGRERAAEPAELSLELVTHDHCGSSYRHQHLQR